MKHVFISINPKWCKLIANGEKTIEVRKTKPKLETPFKCYIYCTQDFADSRTRRKNTEFWIGKPLNSISKGRYIGNGMVIGEFVCDFIVAVSVKYSDTNSRRAKIEFPYTCMTDKEIIDYLGNGNKGYGWHISDLKIYDEPKELKTFKYLCPHKPHCETCKYSINQEIFCGEVSVGCYRYLQRPPQSWCYVEEI